MIAEIVLLLMQGSPELVSRVLDEVRDEIAGVAAPTRSRPRS